MKKVIIGIIIGVVLCIAGFAVYNRIKPNDIIINEEPAPKYKQFKIDESVKNNELVICFAMDDCDVNNLKVKTESKDAEQIDSNKSGIALIKDNGKVKLVYDFTYIVDLKKDYDSIELAISPEKNGFFGFFLTKGNTTMFYDIWKDEYRYTSGYEFLNMLSDKYMAGSNSDGVSVLTIQEENVLTSVKDTPNDGHSYDFESLNGKYIGLRYVCNSDCSDHYEKIYTNDMKEISSTFKAFGFTDEDNLILYDNNKVLTYDKNGTLLGENTDIKNVLLFENNYLLYKDGNTLKITDLKKFDINLVTLSGKMKLSNYTSWDEEINVLIEDSSITLDEIWNACSKNNTCEAETKSELKAYGCGKGRYYTFKIKDKTVSSEPIALCGG